MSRRFRFTILDGLGLIVIAAIVFAAIAFFEGVNSKDEAGEMAVWLTTVGVGLVLALVYRFGLGREARLIALGLAVALAGVADGMYLATYLHAEGTAIAVVAGLSAVGLALVVGGIVAGAGGDQDEAQPFNEPGPRP